MNPDKIIQEILKSSKRWSALIQVAGKKTNGTVRSILRYAGWVDRINAMFTHHQKSLMSKTRTVANGYMTSPGVSTREDFLKSVPVVAECEWGDPGDIKFDFEKLLLARAAVRVIRIRWKALQ